MTILKSHVLKTIVAVPGTFPSSPAPGCLGGLTRRGRKGNGGGLGGGAPQLTMRSNLCLETVSVGVSNSTQTYGLQTLLYTQVTISKTIADVPGNPVVRRQDVWEGWEEGQEWEER